MYTDLFVCRNVVQWQRLLSKHGVSPLVLSGCSPLERGFVPCLPVSSRQTFPPLIISWTVVLNKAGCIPWTQSSLPGQEQRVETATLVVSGRVVYRGAFPDSTEAPTSTEDETAGEVCTPAYLGAQSVYMWWGAGSFLNRPLQLCDSGTIASISEEVVGDTQPHSRAQPEAAPDNFTPLPSGATLIPNNCCCPLNAKVVTALLGARGQAPAVGNTGVVMAPGTGSGMLCYSLLTFLLQRGSLFFVKGKPRLRAEL